MRTAGLYCSAGLAFAILGYATYVRWPREPLACLDRLNILDYRQHTLNGQPYRVIYLKDRPSTVSSMLRGYVTRYRDFQDVGSSLTRFEKHTEMGVEWISLYKEGDLKTFSPLPPGCQTVVVSVGAAGSSLARFAR